jgi:superfamily II DNA/RNA helicase
MTIPDALAGRDVCGKAKTGSGKTLAFGIPIVQRMAELKRSTIGAIILVPTRELAVQVFTELEMLAEGMGLRSLAVYGGADIDKQISRVQKGVELIVATPGRMIDLMDRGVIDIKKVDHVVIDEADRMADMGFLPQVEWILRRIEGEHQTLLFSATLDGAIDGLVSRYQHDPVRHEVEGKEVTVSEMMHRFVTVHDMDRNKVVAAIVNAGKRTMVFCNTKRVCDRLAADLVRLDVVAEAIHGDLRQRQREKALKDFSNGKIQALVATDVAARGIHVDNIAHVVNFDLPQVPEDFIHRVGRTGRAGSRGVSSTFSTRGERSEIRRIERALNVRLVQRQVPEGLAKVTMSAEVAEPKVIVMPRPRPAANGKPSSFKSRKSRPASSPAAASSGAPVGRFDRGRSISGGDSAAPARSTGTRSFKSRSR